MKMAPLEQLTRPLALGALLEAMHGYADDGII